jgi:hypothetical protein
MSLFTLNASDPPWGDYGAILRSGLAERRDDGVLLLRRTGPFVPPVSFPWPTIVIRHDLVQELETQNLTGYSLAPVVKQKIVAIDWEHWDPMAEEPATYPAGGEPENYLLRGRHSRDAVQRMPELHELRVVVTPGLQREGGAVETSLYVGQDFSRGHQCGHIYVSKRAKDWLEGVAGEWVTFRRAHVAG